MHFDEMMLKIGVGSVQHSTLFCCSLLIFTEGFLTSGIFFTLPQVICVFNLPPTFLHNAAVPFLTGLAIGPVFLCMPSDVSGRRSLICLASTITFVSLLYAASSPLFIFFEIATFAAGIGIAGISTVCRILYFETLHMKIRGLLVLMDFIWSIGIILGIVYGNWQLRAMFRAAVRLGALTPGWRVLLLLCALLTLPGGALAGLTTLSPRQMMAHVRLVTAHAVLRRHFAANNREHDSNFQEAVDFPPDGFQYTDRRQLSRASHHTFFKLTCILSYLVDMFRCPFTYRSIILIILNIFLCDGTIVLIVSVAQRLDADKGALMTPAAVTNVTSAGELCDSGAFPSYLHHILLAIPVVVAPLCAAPIIDHCPRPIVLLLSCAYSAIAASFFLFKMSAAVNWVAGCVLILFHTTAVISLNIITMENFPTKFRSTAYGLIKSAARVSLTCTALINDVSDYVVFSTITYGMLLACVFMIILSWDMKATGTWRQTIEPGAGLGESVVVGWAWQLPGSSRSCTMSIKIYSVSDGPPSLAVRMCLKYLNVQHHLIEVDFGAGEHMTEQYAKMNPQKEIPVLDDNGFYLSESNAILQYLADKFSKDTTLYPSDVAARAIVNQRLAFNLSTYYRAIGEYVMLPIFFGYERNAVKQRKVLSALGVLNTFLERLNKKYSAGDAVTIADFPLVTATLCLEAIGFDISQFTAVVSWYDRFKSEWPHLWEIGRIGRDEITEFDKNPPDLSSLKHPFHPVKILK